MNKLKIFLMTITIAIILTISCDDTTSSNKTDLLLLSMSAFDPQTSCTSYTCANVRFKNVNYSGSATYYLYTATACTGTYYYHSKWSNIAKGDTGYHAMIQAGNYSPGGEGTCSVGYLKLEAGYGYTIYLNSGTWHRDTDW